MDSTTDAATLGAERVTEGRERILAELRKVIVGQDEVVEQVLIALFTGGHCLITGVPGLAKTLLIKTLADILDLDFKRIQFTPDLMPSDITGTEILDEEQGSRRLRFVKGPIFAQIILADEINRTPPKTQAALLEAMQESHVTAAGRTYPLDQPFFVLATQNPIELEGTYPLPEAQLDRFMFNVVISYLSEDDEVFVVTQTTGTKRPTPARVLSGPDILQFQELSRQVVIAEEIARYTVRLVDRSRPGRPGAPEFVEKWVKWGAGLRGSQALVRGAKARALMHGRYHVSIKDIQALAKPILRHRIMTNFYAESERVNSDTIIDRLLEEVPVPKSGHVAMHPGARERQFLDPAVVARLGTLELKARTIVEGLLSGLHRSPFKGFSVEFAEYRQYIPGDDLATIDWKVYARSDRHYVKKFEEETNLDCHIMLDVSASMGYGGARHQQARVRRVPGGVARLPDEPSARRGRPDRLRRADRDHAAGERAARSPARAAAGARSAAARHARPTSRSRSTSSPTLMSKRGMVVLISDLLDDPERVIRGLKHFRFRGTDVIVFHVLDPDEIEFPFERATRFEDLETSDEVMAVPVVVREHYLKAIGEFIERYKRELGSSGIDYQLLPTESTARARAAGVLCPQRAQGAS